MPEAERERDVEENEDGPDEALLHFGRYSEKRAALPWEQRTLKEKVNHHLDRIFLVFLVLFLLVLAGEAFYKVWYVTNFEKILKLWLETFTYLFTQEEEEELIEL